MEKNKTKFKVGDKVRLLPFATDVGICKVEVGKTGVIKVPPNKSGWFIKVFMDEPSTIRGNAFRRTWSVNSSQIELVYTKGQQLLLWEWV